MKKKKTARTMPEETNEHGSSMIGRRREHREDDAAPGRPGGCKAEVPRKPKKEGGRPKRGGLVSGKESKGD